MGRTLSVLENQLTTLDISRDERKVLLEKVEKCVNDLSKQSNIDNQFVAERVFTTESYEVTLNVENTYYKPTLLDRIWGLFSKFKG